MMFDAPAKQLLELLNKTGEKGVFTPEQLPQAINQLQTLLRQEPDSVKTTTVSTSPAGSSAASFNNQDSEEDFQPNLAQRAFPLLQLFQQALEVDKPVIWEFQGH